MPLRATAAVAPAVAAVALAGASFALGCVPSHGSAPTPMAASRRVVATQEEVATSMLEGGVVAAAFSGDGRFAAIGGPRGAEVVDMPGRRRVRFIKEARILRQALALSADGRVLAAPGQGNEVRLWDVASGAETAVLAPNAAPHAIAFSPRGDRLAVGGENLAIEVWDL